MLLSTLCWFLQGRKNFTRRTVVGGVECTPVAAPAYVQKE